MDAGLDAGLLARARAPDLRVGRGILAPYLESLGGAYVLVAQPEPLAHLELGLVARAAAHLDATSLDESVLETLLSVLPPIDRLVGIGGGVAMDTAKYLAWRSGTPLTLAPGVISVDASVTNTIALRRGGSVAYVGFVVADPIIVDLELIGRAPARLNRAGVGDVLSIQTARADWAIGARAGRIGFDAGVDAAAGAVLADVYLLADEVAAVTDRALEHLIRAYAKVNALCLTVGHSGPEEGSEHYFAYAAEALTGRTFIHGELVGLGVVLMAGFQGEHGPRAAAFLDRSGVAWRPSQLGIETHTLETILVGLPRFVRETGLPWSVIDEAVLDAATIEDVLRLTAS
jgi:glycerol-1-phosphate dehydrogenase [NAD(P)+]